MRLAKKISLVLMMVGVLLIPVLIGENHEVTTNYVSSFNRLNVDENDPNIILTPPFSPEYPSGLNSESDIENDVGFDQSDVEGGFQEENEDENNFGEFNFGGPAVGTGDNNDGGAGTGDTGEGGDDTYPDFEYSFGSASSEGPGGIPGEGPKKDGIIDTGEGTGSGAGEGAGKNEGDDAGSGISNGDREGTSGDDEGDASESEIPNSGDTDLNMMIPYESDVPTCIVDPPSDYKIKPPISHHKPIP
jgi:hypothetical protein